MFCKYCGTEIKEDSIFCGSCGSRVMENSTNVNHAISVASNSAENLYLIACPSCGHSISNHAEICPHCGYKTIAGEKAEQKLQGLKWEGQARIILLISFILWGIGMILFIISLPTILSELARHSYTYRPPLTNHETENLTKLFMGILMVSVGIGLDIGVAIRNRKSKTNK